VRFSPGCACCGGTGPCNSCAGGLPTTLHLTVTNVLNAACVDGLTVTITFQSANVWNGTVAGSCLNCNSITAGMTCNGTNNVLLQLDLMQGTNVCSRFLAAATIDCLTSIAQALNVVVDNTGGALCVGCTLPAGAKVNLTLGT
jgi:hypothetical protein